MSANLDLTLYPLHENQEHTKRASVPIRFYRSSIPGLVSVVMGEWYSAVPMSLRLDRSQIVTLVGTLNDYLED